MCLQVTYTLPCEHVRTQIIYCSKATVVEGSGGGGTGTSSGSSSGGSGSGSGSKHGSGSKGGASSSSKHHHHKSSSSSSGGAKSKHHSHSSHSHGSSSSSSRAQGGSSSSSSAANTSTGGQLHKKPCSRLTVQSQPYPTPPSYASNPAGYSSTGSPLVPRCPLPDCPFEQKNRCWNCCWCGKSWNETGRCSCIMLIDGNQVRCEHICCPQCEPADINEAAAYMGGGDGGGDAGYTGNSYYQ